MIDVNGEAGGMPITGSPSRILLISSAATQANGRKNAALKLLPLIPIESAAQILGCNPGSMPEGWENEIIEFMSAWSDSSMTGCSLALRGLTEFLKVPVGRPFDVQPVQLKSFLKEAGKKGNSVPRSRLDGLRFAVNHLKITGIPVMAELVTIHVASVQKAAPEPEGAKWPTVQMVIHLERIAADTKQSTVIRYYASSLALCCFLSLRIIDAQRSHITSIKNGLISGRAWDSKNPTTRAPKPFAWAASTQGILSTEWTAPIEEAWGNNTGNLREIGLDFLFPALNAYTMHGEPKLKAPIAKAEHSEIEMAMRSILSMQPLGMERSQSREFTGHSPRHFMTELAGAMIMNPADSGALGRHSTAANNATGPNASEATPAIVKVYARKSAPQREIALRSFVIAHVRNVIRYKGGISASKWDSLEEFGLDPMTLRAQVAALTAITIVPTTPANTPNNGTIVAPRLPGS
jgi:hypothetical protein